MRPLDPAQTGTSASSQPSGSDVLIRCAVAGGTGSRTFLQEASESRARSFELTPALVSSVPSASDSSSLRFTAFVCVLFSFVKRSNTIKKKILKIIKLPFKIFKQVYGILGILGDEKVLDSFFFLFFLFPSFSFPLCPLSPSLPLPLPVSLSSFSAQ